MAEAMRNSYLTKWFVSRSAKCFAGRAVIPAVICLAGLLLVGQASFIHAKALLAQVLLERAFSESLQTGLPVKPWSWADTWPVARIEAPRLGARSIALKGASGQALAFGPGHVDGTPLPGDKGWSVLAAHRDTHFAFLKYVKIGDEIVVTRADGGKVRFFVKATRIVHWARSGVVSSTPGTGLVLSTCWPFNARTQGPLRYLVFAESESF